MVVRPRFWTRVGGVGGIVFFVSLLVLIALMPLSHSITEPAFDAPSSAFLAYAKSEADLPFALGWWEFSACSGLPSLPQFSRPGSELQRSPRTSRRPWSRWLQPSSLFCGWLSWELVLPTRLGALIWMQPAQASF